MPGRVRRDLPRGLRRLQLLPVPHARITGGGSSERRPRSLQFAFKVPEEITVATWPGHARYGAAGRTEPMRSFLDARLFERSCPPAGAVPRPGRHLDLRVRDDPEGSLRERRPSSPDGSTHSSAALPGGFRYAVEIRNPEYLAPGLFRHAQRAKASRTSSTPGRGCPPSARKPQMPGAFTADFTVVRALLRPGRTLRAGRQPLRAVSRRCRSPTRPRATPSARSPRRCAAGPASRLTSS